MSKIYATLPAVGRITYLDMEPADMPIAVEPVAPEPDLTPEGIVADAGYGPRVLVFAGDIMPSENWRVR